jgi:hypothetical protein
MALETPATPDGQLQPARQALADAISDLVDPRPQYTDQGLQWLDSRYHELREALTSQRLGSSHQHQSQAPAWVDAIDLLKDIDHKTRGWEPDWPINDCDEYPTIQRLRQIDARKWRPQDVTTINTITNDIARYNIRINELLEPARIIYLANPCPHCHKTETHRTPKGETEPIRVAALQITSDTDIQANCNHCHSHWPKAELQFLGRLLGNRIEGVTEPITPTRPNPPKSTHTRNSPPNVLETTSVVPARPHPGGDPHPPTLSEPPC